MPDPTTRGRAPTRPVRSMRDALTRHLLPALRDAGFAGELPDLRRIRDGEVHTLGIQTGKRGGRFLVHLGRAPARDITRADGTVIEPSGVTSHDLPNLARAVLNAAPHILEQVWFDYTPTFGDRLRARIARIAGRPSDPEAVAWERAARAVLALLPECERFWAGEAGLTHVRTNGEQERLQWGADWPPDVAADLTPSPDR